MHLASFFPSLSDWGGIIGFVWSNPALFIQQTTISSGVITVVTVGMQIAGRSRPLLWKVLEKVAPTIFVVCVAIAVGSQALATEVLLRFHSSIPDVSETQFTSGLLHLVFFGGAAIFLWGRWKSSSDRQRAWARIFAFSYLAAQIKIFEPPWFSFQGQREMVLWIAWTSLIVLLTWATMDLIRFSWVGETERALRAAGISEGNS